METVGMEVDARDGLTALEHEHVVLLEIGDIHPAIAIEADAVANAAGGKRGEQLGPRGARGYLADRAFPLKVYDVQGVARIDGGSFDAGGILAARRQLAALEQGRFRGHQATCCGECPNYR